MADRLQRISRIKVAHEVMFDQLNLTGAQIVSSINRVDGNQAWLELPLEYKDMPDVLPRLGLDILRCMQEEKSG